MHTKLSTLARRLGVSLALLLSALAVGCGSSGEVSGKVYHKEKPLPGGTVTFLTEGGQSLSGNIEQDGSYKLSNVPTGPVKIGVVYVKGPEVPKGSVGVGPPGGKGAQPPKGALPEGVEFKIPTGGGTKIDDLQLALKKYRDPEQSKLTYTVTGGQQTHDIKLN